MSERAGLRTGPFCFSKRDKPKKEEAINILKDITDSELAALYWDGGLSGKEIAKQLGCSPAAVCIRMKAAGIKARHSSDYTPTKKQIDAWRRNAESMSRLPQTREARRNNGKKNRGKRKRDDYEFGGHEKLRDDGYIKVYTPDHPKATKDGYVMKHHLVMEHHIGQNIPDGYVVHHINHNRADNRIENLMLMTFSEHASLHMKERHNARMKQI